MENHAEIDSLHADEDSKPSGPPNQPPRMEHSDGIEFSPHEISPAAYEESSEVQQDYEVSHNGNEWSQIDYEESSSRGNWVCYGLQSCQNT
jgi:hypothetical protein